MVLQGGGPRCPCSLRNQWPWRVWRLSRSSNLDTLTFYLGAVNGQRSSSFWFKSHDFPTVIPPSTPLTILAELPTHSRIIGSLRPSVPSCHFFFDLCASVNSQTLECLTRLGLRILSLHYVIRFGGLAYFVFCIILYVLSYLRILSFALSTFWACALIVLGLLQADVAPTVGWGKTFWRVGHFFFYKNVTPKWKVEKSIPRCEMNRLSESYKLAVDKI